MRIKNLQINHMTAPVGIDGSNIRMTWTLEGGEKQTAYELQVLDAQGNELAAEKKATDEMFCRLSRALPSRASCRVVLHVWDEKQQKSDPAVTSFVTGIEKNEWKARWIDPEQKIEKPGVRRASYLKKNFVLTPWQASELRSKGAFLYATCHGLMDIFVNGQRATETRFMPGTQQYDKRLMVETIEVSDLLREGENEIVVSLGDGWYRGSMGFGQAKNVYGRNLALLLQLEIARQVFLVTDSSWLATQEGPIGRNDFMDGEEVDARKELSAANWHPVRLVDYGCGNLIARDVVPILEHESFPAKLLTTPAGETVLDFGQNLVGYVSFDLEAAAGQKLTLIHGEHLDGAGNFTVKNFQAPKPVKQRVDYICKDGRNRYCPSKTYMGFRYVKVEADFPVCAESFTAHAVYSDMRVTASFHCGVREIDQLFSNALWSMKGNFIDVPTDCPTREKSGYSGDCQAYVHTAMYLMDCYSVYAKWIREQAAGQYADGSVPQIAPKAVPPRKKHTIAGIFCLDGGIGWSDSFEVVPYRLMQRYGDDSLVRENYEALRKWTDYEIKRAKKTRLVNLGLLPKAYRQYMIDTGWMWGEWLEPGQTTAYMAQLVQKGDPEVGTAFFYLHLCTMTRMADRLGRTDDAARYKALAEKGKEAYRALFLDKGKVKEEKRQCRFVRPIAHDLLSEEEKKDAARDLAALITENGDHLNTGFLTTHELCRSLSRYGQSKKAYDLLLQKDKPGWLYAVKRGCTTIPESWDCFDENGDPHESFNHYSYGAVCGWLMDSVCGIQVSDGAIIIEPCPDKRLGFAEASYDSPYGMIVSRWSYEGDSVRYHIEIPANRNAELRLPGLQRQVVKSGSYDFHDHAFSGGENA